MEGRNAVGRHFEGEKRKEEIQCLSHENGVQKMKEETEKRRMHVDFLGC
jgi:hypothetical protein